MGAFVGRPSLDWKIRICMKATLQYILIFTIYFTRSMSYRNVGYIVDPINIEGTTLGFSFDIGYNSR